MEELAKLKCLFLTYLLPSKSTSAFLVLLYILYEKIFYRYTYIYMAEFLKPQSAGLEEPLKML